MLSAIVVNWNGREDLERCLVALLAQQPPPDEVILADNHSADGSREMVAERFPSVHVHDTGANLGPAAARNRGAALATGELLLFVDNDVFLQPGALAALRAALDDDPSVAVVQARSVCADRPDTIHYDAADLHFLGMLVLHNWFKPLATAQPMATAQSSSDVGAIIALCLLSRRAPFDQVGGFEERMFILYEDNDLSYKLRMHGHRLRLATDAIVHHAGGTAGLSFRTPDARYAAQRTRLHARNRWLLLLRCMRWRTLLLTAPAQAAYALVFLGFSASRGNLLAALAGHCDALLRLPTLLRDRRVQRGRTVPDRDLLIGTPMTYNPGLADRGAKAAVRHGLDRFLVGWWRLVRRWCG